MIGYHVRKARRLQAVRARQTILDELRSVFYTQVRRIVGREDEGVCAPSAIPYRARLHSRRYLPPSQFILETRR